MKEKASETKKKQKGKQKSRTGLPPQKESGRGGYNPSDREQIKKPDRYKYTDSNPSLSLQDLGESRTHTSDKKMREKICDVEVRMKKEEKG